MIEVSVKEIAQAAEGELFSKDENAAVKSFSIDSRAIKQGEFFIALKGKNFDGHDYIQEAIGKGACGIIAERPIGLIPSGHLAPSGHFDHIKNFALFGHYVVVNNTTAAMGKIAGHIRRKAAIPVIGITGTNGKTTLKEILFQLLSSGYNPLKSPASYNNIVGVSLALFGLEPSHEIAIIELGSNHPGEMRDLSRIAAPQVAVITNIGRGHLEFFGSRKGVFKEKTGLLEHLPHSGRAFLNGDDAYLSRITTDKDTRFFGRSPGCDFRISGVKKERNGLCFDLNKNEFFVPLEGEHNVYNAAAAVSVASYFGIDRRSIRKRLSEVSRLAMRCERVCVAGIVFINDSYNANPDSFECGLKVLGDTITDGKKIVAAGGMLELGERSSELHRKIGESIAAANIDFLITAGALAKFIADGALAAGMDKSNIFCRENQEDAARAISELANPSDVVLLKGSRGTRMEEVIQCFTTSCTR